MAEAHPGERRRRGEGLSAFQELEARARRLETSIFLLVAFIAFAPPFFFSVVELRNLRARAAVHAGHVATTLELYGRMPQASPDGLLRHLGVELERDDLAGIQVLGRDGRELFHLGTALPVAALDAVERELPLAAGPYARVRVRLHHQLGRDVARIVSVHLVVGLVLGLGIYRIPVRAFGRAIEELKSAQAQLVHSNRLGALGSMYAGLAHEVNNPLGILSARVKLVLAAARERKLDDDTVRDLEVIDRQGMRIATTMRSLLAFARKEPLSLRPVDLNAVVREIAALVERSFSEQGVTVRTELDPALPPLRGSPDQMQQVLLNLVNNARDAMPAGGVITLRTRQRGGRILAEVGDTGPGLAAPALEHLFEPFFTTKDVGKGTGLGLSVSYGIVKALGGEIDGSNLPGSGALFRLTLPAATEAR